MNGYINALFDSEGNALPAMKSFTIPANLDRKPTKNHSVKLGHILQ
jgi:hypothetical protein